MDWYDILCLHLRVSETIRVWFATKVLLAHPHRFSEYLLECPSADVRASFSKIIIFLSHYALMEETQVEVQQSSGKSSLESGMRTNPNHCLYAQVVPVKHQ